MDLVNLPPELLANILAEEGPLTWQDIKSVRLTCRTLCQATTPILFYRIQISPLIQDLETFLNIAYSDLSRNVRVVVWNELNGDLSAFDPTKVHDINGNNDDTFFETLVAGAEDLFWIKFWDPDLSDPAMFDLSKDPAFNRVIAAFQRAIISEMPNLHTLASKAMDPHRRLKMPRSEYPMTVEAIRRFINNNESKCAYNLGFTAFLVPTLKALAKAPQPNVTRLIYVDESNTAKTALARLKVEDSEVFSTLRQLHICMGGQNVDGIDLEGFLVCLGNARDLVNLQLCQERVWQYLPFTPDFLRLISTLPCLTEVYLNEVLPASAPGEFIHRHGTTLKRVTVIPRDDLEEGYDEEDCDDDDYDDEGEVGGQQRVSEQVALDYTGLPDREIHDDEVAPGMDVDVDMRPFYTQSEEAQNLRAKNAPRWDWGRDDDGGVWYWQVPNTDGHATYGHETEMWLFEHNGEHAYGQDPLEVWADWDDGPDSEDKATPTPYGRGVLQFLLQEGEVGSRIPFEDRECQVIRLHETAEDLMFL
ncbi:hypothetical protein ACHAPJ_007343 [Fusarium lateritium]